MTVSNDPLCECGCRRSAHHVTFWFSGGVSYDECFTYGCNETGGLRRRPTWRWPLFWTRHGRYRWVRHCGGFKERT